MKKVKLYIIDSSLFSLDELLSIPLNDEEKQRVEKARTLQKQKERLLSVYLKRKYIGEYYLDKHKKPVSEDKFFNISHSDDIIILGMCDVAIGVDVEHIKEISAQMKRYIASDDELEYMSDKEKFFEVWTNKESLMKCKGTGIVSKPKGIQGLPINGIRILDNEPYMSRTIKQGEYLISVCIKGDEQIEIDLVNITSIQPD